MYLFSESYWNNIEIILILYSRRSFVLQETQFKLFLRWSTFISASTISWFYFIENMTTVLLSDTPWCFSPTMIYVILIRFIAVINIFEKKVKSYLYYIICFVSFSRMYKISNVSSDETHVFKDISIDMYHSQDKRCIIVLCALYQIRRRFACDESYYLCIFFNVLVK